MRCVDVVLFLRLRCRQQPTDETRFNLNYEFVGYINYFHLLLVAIFVEFDPDGIYSTGIPGDRDSISEIFCWEWYTKYIKDKRKFTK